jgi:hypothetical protein
VKARREGFIPALPAISTDRERWDASPFSLTVPGVRAYEGSTSQAEERSLKLAALFGSNESRLIERELLRILLPCIQQPVSYSHELPALLF